MSKKSNKTKAPKAGGKKAKAEASQPASEQATTAMPAAGFQINKDAKGR